ncbi:hypothetical protein KIN20_029657 [Parelaphostrongylus tenuis]|uniref:Uncharacterized protein n=1 Tax=Parelaphostrongylus tenuis TaxID=148309 RepID=A0AAD5WFS1_PARTN|nr:hypothetical protein KIN20_029657 [Parelaphostrongylus tenuis]
MEADPGLVDPDTAGLGPIDPSTECPSPVGPGSAGSASEPSSNGPTVVMRRLATYDWQWSAEVRLEHIISLNMHTECSGY